jgi:putative transposase
MYRICRFQEVMRGLPRDGFQRVVDAHEGDKYSKGFSCWDQLLVMSYGQLAGASGLRDLEVGFNRHRMQHYHLGTHEVRRSTLADANRRRNPEVFAAVARRLMGQVQRRVRRQSERLMYLLDATAITLRGDGFDAWTKATRTDHHQGVKLHTVYAVQAQAPCQASITAANVNDIVEGVKVPLQADAVYVFDKGYYDFGWWHQINQAGALFVSRFKNNVRLKRLQRRAVPRQAAGVVLADERVQFDNLTPRGGHRNRYTQPLRRIVVARPENDTPLVLATNDLRSSALTIAQRYKDRWQIELFFKWIKQHLKITRFVGRSENAVRIQILIALITYLLLSLYRAAHASTASLWEVLRELRLTLFQRPETEAAVFRRRREQRAEFARLQPALFR